MCPMNKAIILIMVLIRVYVNLLKFETSLLSSMTGLERVCLKQTKT